jgi:membrane-associated phospholipid phosphatase
MKSNAYIKTIMLSMLLSCTAIGNAQSWQDNWLKKIHVERNTSHQHFYKAITNSARWVAISEVTSQLIVGYSTKNSTTIKNGYTSLATLATTYGITQISKRLIKRNRPFVGNSSFTPYDNLTDYSFPSGHSSIAFATASNIAFQYKKWYVVVPAYAWATAVAYSRMYLGVHYPTDVIVGALLGTGTAYIANKLKEKVFAKKYPKKLLYIK